MEGVTDRHRGVTQRGDRRVIRRVTRRVVKRVIRTHRRGVGDECVRETGGRGIHKKDGVQRQLPTCESQMKSRAYETVSWYFSTMRFVPAVALENSPSCCIPYWSRARPPVRKYNPTPSTYSSIAPQGSALLGW